MRSLRRSGPGVCVGLVTVWLAAGCSLRKEPVMEPRVTGPVDIGRVLAVNRSLNFVLIESHAALGLRTGTSLRVGGTGGPDGGEVRISSERRSPFVAAEIVRPPVGEGDRVYYLPLAGGAESDAAASGSVVSPGGL